MHRQEISEFLEAVNKTIAASGLSALEFDLEKDTTQMESPNIWDDVDKATKISKNIKLLEDKIESINRLKKQVVDLQTALDLGDEDLIQANVQLLEKIHNEFQEKNFLDEKYDLNDCLLTIHAGAGGVDAEDFAAMLCAMYQSFSKTQGYSFQTVHIDVGEEGGLKTVTLEIKGDYAYGLLKEEVGVHRLVRISPFNAGKTRETSFASVEVLPRNVDDSSKIEIKEEDLKWEYSTASGNGGQSVNTTYSAVRLTHLPTNTHVSCQNERSQVQNKAMALKYLKDKLAVIELERQRQAKKELKGEINSVEWGSQIRHYVLHPYKLVKDVRSGWETSNVLDVLEQGNILDIIWSVKRARQQNKIS
jgi:peptide chain release factor 2